MSCMHILVVSLFMMNTLQIDECKDVVINSSTDPFTKVTTISGVTPKIGTSDAKTEPSTGQNVSQFKTIDLPSGKTFQIHLSLNNDGMYLNFYYSYPIGYYDQDPLKPIINTNSKLLLLLENDDVITLNYQGEQINVTDSRDRESTIAPGSRENRHRFIGVNGKFYLSNEKKNILSENSVKMLRIEFQNLREDRVLDEDDQNYFKKYLKCFD
jgi:hypothetical protein